MHRAHSATTARGWGEREKDNEQIKQRADSNNISCCCCFFVRFVENDAIKYGTEVMSINFIAIVFALSLFSHAKAQLFCECMCVCVPHATNIFRFIAGIYRI